MQNALHAIAVELVFVVFVQQVKTETATERGRGRLEGCMIGVWGGGGGGARGH